METTTLTTERLLLRPFEERDTDAVTAASNDPEIARYIPVPSPYAREDAEEYIHGISANGWERDSMYNFGVFLRESGALVGSVCLVRLDRLPPPQHQAELGYWTAPEQRGRGYTVEAGRAVVDWAFGTLGVERLEWWAEVGNAASWAVAERLGFVREGVHRARIVHRGVRRDAWSAALLPSDLGRPMVTPYLPSQDR